MVTSYNPAGAWLEYPQFRQYLTMNSPTISLAGSLTDLECLPSQKARPDRPLSQLRQILLRASPHFMPLYNSFLGQNTLLYYSLVGDRINNSSLITLLMLLPGSYKQNKKHFLRHLLTSAHTMIYRALVKKASVPPRKSSKRQARHLQLIQLRDRSTNSLFPPSHLTSHCTTFSLSLLNVPCMLLEFLDLYVLA